MTHQRPTPPRPAAHETAALRQSGATPLRVGDPARVGPFLPVALLGSGGMGRVYLARAADDSPGLFAVKVIRPEYAEDAEFQRRFEREAAVHTRIGPPHVPRLCGTGFDDELLWMATEYLPGLDLADAVRRTGALPTPTVWRLAAQLGRALAVLAAADVVHRDLKPSNVLLTLRGVHLIDFGISKAADASALTGTGNRVGTAAYMSPEYLRTGRVETASDVFSLAGTLTYAVTGHAPFGDGTGVDVMHRVAFEEPNAEVAGAVSAADPDLRALLIRCLAKEPELRPTPAELIGITEPHAGADEWPERLQAEVLARQRADEVLRGLPVARAVLLRPTDNRAAGAAGRRGEGVRLGTGGGRGPVGPGEGEAGARSDGAGGQAPGSGPMALAAGSGGGRGPVGPGEGEAGARSDGAEGQVACSGPMALGAGVWPAAAGAGASSEAAWLDGSESRAEGGVSSRPASWLDRRAAGTGPSSEVAWLDGTPEVPKGDGAAEADGPASASRTDQPSGGVPASGGGGVPATGGSAGAPDRPASARVDGVAGPARSQAAVVPGPTDVVSAGLGPARSGKRRKRVLAVVMCAALCAVAVGAFVLLRQQHEATAIAPGAVGTATGAVSGNRPGNTLPSGASGAPDRASAAGSSDERADGDGGGGGAGNRGNPDDEGGTGTTGAGGGTGGGAGQPATTGGAGDDGGQDAGDPSAPSVEDSAPADDDPVTTATSPAAEPAGRPWNTDCNYYAGKKRTQEGDTGKRVFQVQCILSKRGYNLGSTGIDGVYGAATVSAMQAFQADKGLATDGIVRRATWAVLRATV